MRFNVYPLYICNKNRECAKSEGCVINDGTCSLTTNPDYAKNQEAVDIYNKFFETFDPIYEEDSNGLIGYVEKEK